MGPQLYSLDLSWNNFIGATLPRTWLCFQRLETLRINNANLSGPLPDPMNGTFCRLQGVYTSEFDLSYNPLNILMPTSWLINMSVASVDQSAPTSRILNLENSSIKGTLPELPAATYVPNGSFSATTTSPRLQLYVGRNQLQGTIPVSYVCGGVAILSAGDNRLVGTLPLPPNKTTSFLSSTLNVSFNQLVGTIPDRYFTSMSSFIANNNQFDGTLPATTMFRTAF